MRSLLVDDIIAEERALSRLNKLPTEAAPPHHRARVLGVLGTADADALAIESKSLFSAEELLAKAKAAMERREKAGVWDSVESLQPLRPDFDMALVGKRLEVCWPYHHLADGSKASPPNLIWTSGRVVRVADGLTDTRSSRARKILPAGMVLWAWRVGRRRLLRREGGRAVVAAAAQEVQPLQLGRVRLALRPERAGERQAERRGTPALRRPSLSSTTGRLRADPTT